VTRSRLPPPAPSECIRPCGCCRGAVASRRSALRLIMQSHGLIEATRVVHHVGPKQAAEGHETYERRTGCKRPAACTPPLLEGDTHPCAVSRGHNLLQALLMQSSCHVADIGAHVPARSKFGPLYRPLLTARCMLHWQHSPLSPSVRRLQHGELEGCFGCRRSLKEVNQLQLGSCVPLDNPRRVVASNLLSSRGNCSSRPQRRVVPVLA
jgi:hypothetical protein